MATASPYRAPGIYVEWPDTSGQNIDVGRTDVAGFVGIAECGPLHRPTKVESLRQFRTVFGGPMAQSYLAYAVAGFFGNSGRTCWITRVADPARATAARVRLACLGCTPFVLMASSPGRWGDDVLVEPVWGPDRIQALAVSAPERPAQVVELDAQGGPRDARPPTRLGIPQSAVPELAPDVLVSAAADDDSSLPVRMLVPGLRGLRLSGGDDGLSGLLPAHFIANPSGDKPWGVEALARVDGVSFVAVPDLMFRADPLSPPPEFKGFEPGPVLDAQVELLSSCAARRDRMAILDAPRGGRNTAHAHRDGLPRSRFGALYHPWIHVDDPLRLQGNVRAIPPSGHLAGVYARTDRQRGVHVPPANQVVEGVWDLADAVDEAAHSELNDAGINAIRVVPGRNVLVLSARTLEPQFEWRYVNVSRLFAMIEEALEEQMQWLVFEPNNPHLWREVDRGVRGFLGRLYGLGVLDGATEEKAYFVRCDETTNPAEGTDQGRVTCEMGIQPPFPAEFVVARIGVTRNGIQIEEKGAQHV